MMTMQTMSTTMYVIVVAWKKLRNPIERDRMFIFISFDGNVDQLREIFAEHWTRQGSDFDKTLNRTLAACGFDFLTVCVCVEGLQQLQNGIRTESFRSI